MTRKHSTYAPEFKTQAISLVREANRSAIEVAKELNLNINTLYNWLHANKKGSSKKTVDKESESEIKHLKKELAQSNLERDILKKAYAYFAKETL